MVVWQLAATSNRQPAAAARSLSAQSATACERSEFPSALPQWILNKPLVYLFISKIVIREIQNIQYFNDAGR